MKKILLIFPLILLITACTQIQAEPVPKVVTVTETVIETIEVENTVKINELQDDIARYQALLKGLNGLLANVYYGYASNNSYTLEGFTAFSIEYKGKYYLITAGHSVENNGTIFTDFKFKANYGEEWIYPILLTYKVTKISPDYAVFYSDKIDRGFRIGTLKDDPNFVLGTTHNNLNVIRDIKYRWGKPGECGSPLININGEVIGVYTGYTTDIDIVLEAIDNLE